MGAIRVLLVEDNQATRDLLRSFLEGSPGLEVCGEAGDGREGLEVLRRERPDLVLLDLVMPGLDGMGLLRALREEPVQERPKVIVLSGVGADEYVQRACELGAKYYLVKPVNLVELASHIELLFPKEEAERPETGLAAWLLLRLGADRRLEGYRYACFAAELFLSTEREAVQMKEVYLRTAHRFGTSYSCVEKNLRTLVRNIHGAGKTLYTGVMGFGGLEKPPENSVFLHALARELKKNTEGTEE